MVLCHTTQQAIVSESATAGSRKAKSLATNESARRGDVVYCAMITQICPKSARYLVVYVSDIREYDNATGPNRQWLHTRPKTNKLPQTTSNHNRYYDITNAELMKGRH
jgi:hypothetical protein